MIDGQKFYDQLVKNDMRRYDHIRKMKTVQCDDYTTGCFLGYPYFKEHCKVNCNRFKWIASAGCWHKINTTN